ncbi:OmpW/AlkL family protein [Pseudomonas syringae]|uniref:OmpW/AlkL family protein n=1 Tax=Pseudomonas syringae TaxID=317 RepID=UPI00137279D6|nr:OmpW family outer membrane protein [Pseudomonas syringae]MDU8431914.1 OmpW family outer membrane protein [Pseudomonas syringae pv. actinidifoliorum]MDU8523237.1 OmpW family outer membrane protein [Pseudomonas syringae pv. actinidifoliorum]MDU8528973.1 OmpW family outer membrane protein [Pseudomonas syringae pv. actinidifoliorum]NAS95432.1 outer membrane protein OmpW [Pseudomonas syringae pv. actinidifoliorum]NAT26425.1 outer membrane protein OmpW [Pseudomonas syringae pv. actinidifoliorum]
MNKHLLRASLAALALTAPVVANAYESGDFIVRAGAAHVQPNEDSGEVRLDGAKVSGTKSTLNGDTQLGLTFAYMLTNHIGIELLAATPFNHTVSVKGLGPGLDGKLADVKHLPPTLSLQYYPMEPSSRFQPYAGVGINYTTFFDNDLTSDRKSQGFSNLKLKDSVGLAAQLGMDYMITDNVLVNASVWYVDIDTKATVDGPSALAVGQTKVDVDIDPWVYMVGVGYKF